MSKLYRIINNTNEFIAHIANQLDSISLLALRLYVSWIFFPAGILKLNDWDTTLFLFEEEYQVPFLSPDIAAWLGTTGELVFPALLVFGLLTRASALGLFTVNIVAVISLAEIAPAALAHHIIWGLSLAVVLVFGGGNFSLDRLISKRTTISNDMANSPLVNY